MTRKRYIKLKMAEGFSRNEAALRAKKVELFGMSYREGHIRDAMLRYIRGVAMASIARAICKAFAVTSLPFAKEILSKIEEVGSHGNT